MSACEYNPTDKCARFAGEPSHGEATVCVGYDGAWHLCASCAALPEFRKYRSKRPLPRKGSTP